MTYGPTRENLTEAAWNQRRIGIWFGAWVQTDLEKISDLSSQDAAKILSALPAQKRLGVRVTSKYIDVIRRFENISPDDWVFTYFSQTLHLAQVNSKVLSNPIKSLERKGEPFKARKITNVKAFALDRLPESFRLLSGAGRGTLHQLGATRVLVEMLAKSSSAEEVISKYRKLDWKQWLEALGPKGWETLCLGYLIYERNFVPTGVGVGGTMADFDVVGRTRDGHPILAQCKKTPHQHIVSDKEAEAYRDSRRAEVYLFAYKGAVGVPDNVTVLTEIDIENWFTKNVAGRAYLKLLTGK